MATATITDEPMAEDEFLALRAELLRASTKMSCSQTLELADVLHTVIRLRKPCRRLRNLDDLFLDEAGRPEAAALH
jgi:hypothetical protein